MTAQLKSADPCHEEPRGYATPEEREAALMDALKGVKLGDYDGRIIAWMVSTLDTSTITVIVGLLRRTRNAGMVDAVDLQAYLDAQPKQDHPR